MDVLTIQRALKARGYDPGPLDGINGRRTQAAVRAFQQDNGLAVDGIAGSKTLAKLLPSSVAAAVSIEPPWYVEAKRLAGTREIAGARSNPTIIGWAKRLGGWVASFYTNDDTPWCGLFAAHCIGMALPNEPIPSNPLGAVNWARFGRSLMTPARGAILVFSRDGGGHVGFYVGEDGTAYHVLGGNQSNTVNITRVAKSRHIATRWPSTVGMPTTGRVMLAATTKLSINEA